MKGWREEWMSMCREAGKNGEKDPGMNGRMYERMKGKIDTWM